MDLFSGSEPYLAKGPRVFNMGETNSSMLKSGTALVCPSLCPFNGHGNCECGDDGIESVFSELYYWTDAVILVIKRPRQVRSSLCVNNDNGKDLRRSWLDRQLRIMRIYGAAGSNSPTCPMLPIVSMWIAPMARLSARVFLVTILVLS